MLRSNLRARPRLLGYDIIGCTVIWALFSVCTRLGSACQSHSILHLSVVLVGLGLAWRSRQELFETPRYTPKWEAALTNGESWRARHLDAGPHIMSHCCISTPSAYQQVIDAQIYTSASDQSGTWMDCHCR